MKEIVFINRNSTRWKEFEIFLKQGIKGNPDELADLFIQVTDDLSYARTYFPYGKSAVYLNSLALQAHQLIYRNKKESRSRFITFWLYELPLLYYDIRKYILYSFLIFFISALIGVISSANDKDFVRLIMGDSYVNMTLQNIEDGDPMAVYKRMRGSDMMLYISFNNIRVSFIEFVAGIFTAIGTAFILFQNGIMIGAFQYFFYEHGVLYESILSIWIHGTIEIFIIIVAGAAGMILGNSMIFTGTYKRVTSIKRGAKKGIKVIIGLVPLFILAAILEGFVTRHTEWHDIIRIGIILASTTFITIYFFIYPRRLYLRNFKEQ